MPGDVRYEVTEISGRACRPADAHVCEDRPVRITLNGGPVGAFDACPGDLRALACGYLLCEGRIPSAEAIESVIIEADCVAVRAGPCARRRPRPGPAPEVEARVIFERYMSLGDLSPLGRRSGGTRCAAIFTASGGAVSSAEDVHGFGAVSRAIGKAALDGGDLRGCFLLSTGRMTPWIVQGLANAGLALAVGCSMPSDRAIEAAIERGIGLAAVPAPGYMYIYSGHGSITGIPESSGPSIAPAATSPGYF